LWGAAASLIGSALLAAVPAIQSAAVTPSSGVVGSPTTILFTAAIRDPQAVPVSVNLQRAAADGTYTNISRLYDDGTNGDVKAGDRIYSVSMTVSERAPGVMVFRVSAAVRGSLSRIFSDPMNFNITSGRS
jgi:hypothetical protein